MQTFELANGLKMPVIGTGTNTFAKTDGKYDGHTDEVVSAIKAGYRLIDTAESYGNEEAVGLGIRESGIPREEFFICTKMRTKAPGKDSVSLKPQDAVDAIERSLKKLGTDYLDLYLIHMPWGNPEETAEVWKVFEEYYEKGVLRAIGVSNFGIDDLTALMSSCRIKPMADEVKIAPGSENEELVGFMQKNGILPIAWGPLKFEEGRDELAAVGEKYSKSWAQVVLRRNLQKGIVSIPKSHSFEHQKENLDVFDFELTDEDLKALGDE